MTSSGAGSARTLRIKCPTWDHVVDFYTVKVKDRRTLSVRVPFNPVPHSTITIALELPNDIVIAVDALAERVQPAADGKRAAVRLVLQDASEVIDRLESLVFDSRGGKAVAKPAEPRPVVTPAATRRPQTEIAPTAIPADAPINELIEQPITPTIDDVSSSQRNEFLRLDKVLTSMREAAAHEVLGVPWGASVAQIRAAYCILTKNFHPDLFARHQSTAIMFMAQEVFILVNKAYDRMRDAAAEAGHAIIAGSALVPHDGWLAGFDDLGTVRPRSPLSKNEQGNVPQQAIRIPMPDGATSPSRKKHHTASGSVKVNFRSGSGARPVAAPVASSPAVLPAEPPAAKPPVAEPPAAKPPVAEPLTAKPAAGPSSSSLFSTDELFANLGWDDDGGDPEASRSISIESPADESRETAKQQSAEGLLKQGLVALEKAEYETAKETFAEVLKVEPRNRKARALYYVAGARTLMDDGNRVEAMTQLEAALAHDPSCEQAIEARQMISSGIKRSGLFRRLFTK